MKILRKEELISIVADVFESIRVTDAGEAWSITFHGLPHRGGGVFLYKEVLLAAIPTGSRDSLNLLVIDERHADELFKLFCSAVDGVMEDGECEECFGTGLKGGFHVPCSRGCQA